MFKKRNVFDTFHYTKMYNVYIRLILMLLILLIFLGDDFSIIQQEILMMQDCHHSNIIEYYGSYLRRDKLWICMEYCSGGSLQDIYHSEYITLNTCKRSWYKIKFPLKFNLPTPNLTINILSISCFHRMGLFISSNSCICFYSFSICILKSFTECYLISINTNIV